MVFRALTGLLTVLIATACGDNRDATPRDAPSPDARHPARVMAFSRTLGYRHDSIAAALAAANELGATRNWTVTATEDPAALVTALPETDVVVFLLSSGDVLDAAQEAAFESWFRAGGAYVGVHSATDTEYDWPFYQELVGAPFLTHPPGQPSGVINVEEHSHPATAHLSTTWVRNEEFYTLAMNPADRPEVHVLLALDEDASMTEQPYRMGYHPLAWYHQVGGRRAFTTVLGHSIESYSDPDFRAHLAGAIDWASGADDPRLLLEEFIGQPTGAWDPHQYGGTFAYAVTPNALTIIDRNEGNQHLTRRSLEVDPSRPYGIDMLFRIPLHSRDTADDDINSFCINFDVQGEGGDTTDLAHLYARAVNVDITRSIPGQVVMKTMGFVDGSFRSLGDRITSCCAFDQEYRMSVEVRGDTVLVRISQGAMQLDEAVLDYTPFPYQPDRTRPVRIGVNEHGTDWTMRDLRVRYLD